MSCVPRTGCGVGVKVELVVDRTGVPVGLATDAAHLPDGYGLVTGRV
mgnify:CR=1 FL=1